MFINMTRNLRKRRGGQAGFSFAEVLAAAAIIGVLAALAIPFTLRAQARASEVALRADLVDVAASVTKALRNWRAKAPGMMLYICHTPYESPYPASTPRPNTCNAGEWDIRTGVGALTTPSYSGDTRDNNIVQGVIAPDGSYCLDAYSDNPGVTSFHITSDNADPEQGTCLDADWRPTGGIRGNTKAGWGSMPAPGIASAAPVPSAPEYLPTSPLGLAVCTYGSTDCAGPAPGKQQATITWNITPGVTYQIDVSGQPSRYATFNSGTVGTCQVPANQCAGPFFGYLPVGTYKASVRVKNSKGWSPYASVLFTVSASG